MILVQYQRYHVPKYHQWMQSEELQYLTNSEPLTLEEEYLMFETWMEDSNKCTFIVLDRARFESIPDNVSMEEREIESMIGDVNFYIHNRQEDGDHRNSEPLCAEIEIMIAERAARGKGFGREAALTMMQFAHTEIGVDKFEAKIKISNHVSQHLFTNYFAFREISRSEVNL